MDVVWDECRKAPMSRGKNKRKRDELGPLVISEAHNSLVVAWHEDLEGDEVEMRINEIEDEPEANDDRSSDDDSDNRPPDTHVDAPDTEGETAHDIEKLLGVNDESAGIHTEETSTEMAPEDGLEGTNVIHSERQVGERRQEDSLLPGQTAKVPDKRDSLQLVPSQIQQRLAIQVLLDSLMLRLALVLLRHVRCGILLEQRLRNDQGWRSKG
ncbi:hypothetical protein IW262DRAFT_1518698 [Armillaria fumosa]|nr:hypothetical protein IW262DRAFT_1518698 [Armillaria fumosa]